MSDLVEFLLARIAEDEEIARKAHDTRHAWVAAQDVHGTKAIGLSGSRVLAECEAKRRIVTQVHHPANLEDDGSIDPYASPREAEFCMGCGFGSDEQRMYRIDECPTLRLLALPYADHPDYQREWAP